MDLATSAPVTLRPAAAATAAATGMPRPPVAPAAGPASPRILVVDDEPSVRRLIGRILAMLGYTVMEAGGGRPALALVEASAEPIDLVITDVMMPDMNGITLAEEVAARFPAIRLLFVSGYARGAGPDTNGVAARVPLLTKPFTPAELERAVADLLVAGSGPGAPGADR